MLLAVGATLLLSSCGIADKLKPSASDGENTEVAEEAQTDSASTTAVRNIPFEVREFKEVKGENELEIEYPVQGNPELVTKIRMWISECLNDTYRGNLDDPEAFFRHYASRLGEDPELNEYGGFTQDDFELEYVNDYVVTYDYTFYMYEGGAHGMGGTYGTTFLQSDGTVFTKGCFTSYKPLQPLIIAGLKRYFKVTTDQELKDCLLTDSPVSSITPPGTDPWITKEGVKFSYTPYEIAPYSAGSPSFTIPFREIEPYLNADGKKFFGLD